MRPLTLRLPITRLLVALVLIAAGMLVAVPPATAAPTSGVCHLTDAGHYTWERVEWGEVREHRAHDGDLVGPHITAADCPGATITPTPVRYDRAATVSHGPTGFRSWYAGFKWSVRSNW